MMSRIPNYPTDDNDAVFSSSLSSSEHYHHDAQPIRLSSSSSSSSSSNRRDSLPPTRTGQVRPGEAINPLRLVRAETNPLANQALETLSAIERQKRQTQKETTTSKKSTMQADTYDVDWEQNLSSWKDRRKSKPTYQPKALEIGEDHEDTASSSAAGKRSKTFKELMEEKEKRSNGLGLYTYESEDSSGPSRDASSRDAAAVTPTSKTPISSTSAVVTTAAVTTDVTHHSKVLDPVSDASRPSSSVSQKREFYFADSLMDGVSGDLKTSVPPSSAGNLEAGTLLVQQRPQEISLEFRAPTEISAPETKVLIQKTSTAIESASSADSGSDSERKPWRSTERRASALAASGPSTGPSSSSSSGVTLRDRPPGGTRQPRPSSYAFTGSAKTEVPKPSPMRPTAAQVGGSTRRESAGGGVRPLLDHRQVNPPPPPPGALTRDRRVKSNWELNFSQSFDKSDRQEFMRHPHPPPPQHQQQHQQQQQQKSTEASSSAKFKQALSLFQSKEAEAGRPPPPPKAPLTTHRSSLGGRMVSTRLPTTDEPLSTKPIRATAGGVGVGGVGVGVGGGFEAKRPIAATASATYAEEPRTNRQAEEARTNRDFSRSVHGGGLNDDVGRLLDRGIPDRRRSMYDQRSKYDDDNKYDWRKGEEKQESSHHQRSFENDHSNADKSPSKDADKTKNTVTRVEDVSPEVSVLRTRVEANRDTAPDDDERERIGVGSTVSWTLKLGADPSPGKEVDISYDQRGAFPETPRRRTSGIQSSVVHEEYSRAGIPETRPRDGETRGGKHGGSFSGPDWRTDQRSESLTKAQLTDSNEPKSLYAFKYQTTNVEESIVEGRDKIQTKATDFKRTSYAEMPSDTKDSLIQTTEGPATKSRDLTETLKDSYKMEETSFHADSSSRQRNKPNQQPSISDIFSKRSADELRVRGEPAVHHRPFSAAPSQNTAQDEQKHRKEVEPTTTKFNDDVKSDGERHDGEPRTKDDVTAKQRLVGDVTAGFHDDDRTSQREEPEVRGLERTHGEPNRRRYGLGRYDYGEEVRAAEEKRGERPEEALHEPSEQTAQPYNLRQDSAFEVNFSSFGLEKKSAGDGIETDKDGSSGKTDRPLVEGGFDGSLLSEPSEIKSERNEKTSRESSSSSPGAAVRYPSGDHGLMSTSDRLKSHHEDFILEENLNSAAADMRSVELDSSVPFQVNAGEAISLSRGSNGVLTLTFTEAEVIVVEELRPETKGSRPDVSGDFVRGGDSPPDRPQNSSGAASETTRSRSLTEDDDESSPSSPLPPPLPLGKPPNILVDSVSSHSPSFEFSFALPPPSGRMPSPEPVSREPASREPASREPVSREPVSREPASPEPASPEPASREPVSREPMSREPVSREPASREPVSLEPASREPVSPERVRNTDAGKLIDFGADDKIGLSEFSERDLMSEKSSTKAEIVFKDEDDDDDDHKGAVSVDGNSNISFDQTAIHSLPPANILHQQSPTVSLSFDQTRDSKAASLSSKEQQKTNYDASAYSDESPSKTTQNNEEDTSSGGSVTSSVKISPNNPPPPKKKPPEVPKTKPKPKIPPKSGDDWGFLTNTQLLDTSANRDKCRLAREGPMAVKRRPKSAFIPSTGTGDLFDISNGGHRGETESGVINGYREDAIDGGGRDGARDRDLSAGRSEEAIPPLRPKTSLKGTRPLSYMGELNSSLAKKFKGVAAADDGKEELNRGDQLKDNIGNAPAADESSSSRYGELEVVDSSEKLLIRPRGSVKMPGLMSELNLSLKKKFQDNTQDSTGRETEHSILRREEKEEKTFRTASDATANSLKSTVANDDDDDERGADVPPPPLPNAPPPLPNWNSFPGDSPAGPPLPPSGPPPALIDFGSSGEEEGEEDDSGKIEFRVDASAIHRQAPAPDQKWWQHEESEKTDEMDFSFA